MIKLFVLAGAAMLVGMVAVSDDDSANGDDQRAIEIVVHVRDYNDTPLEDVLLAIEVDGDLQADAATDANGDATILANVSDDSQVRVRHAFANPETSFDDSREQVRLSRRLTSLREHYSVSGNHDVALSPDVDSYQLDIELHKAVQIRGVVTDEDDRPVGFLVWGPLPMQLANATGGKQFTLKGVRAGERTTLLVGFKTPAAAIGMIPKHISAAQADDNLDLGHIIVPAVEPSVELDIQLSSLHAAGRVWPGISFVQADGSVAFAMRAQDRNHPEAGRVMGSDENPVSLPAGEYYLVPGSVTGSPTAELWAVFEALRHGRDLDALGIHAITLEPGEERSLELDLVELKEPITAMMELTDG